ncbi:lysophospholipase [uncultured Gammaproteobacteria bacterium]
MLQTDTLTAPDGWRLRWGQWPAPISPPPHAPAPRGTVVVLGGRCEFLESYDDIAQCWVKRGYRVFSLDWRGQGLSGRFLANRHKGHVPDFNLLADDLALFLTRIVTPATRDQPPIFFAHSMGSLVALLYLCRQSALLPQAMILSTPLLDLRTRPWPRWLARGLARAATTLGCGDGYAFGQSDYNPTRDAVFEGNIRTSNIEQFAIWHRAVTANPDLALGGVTFGWLEAAFRAFAVLAKPGMIERLDLPILVLSSPDDGLIPPAAHHALCQRAPHATLCSYPGSRHEVLRESESIQQRVWADIDRFLADKTET